jgi:hypothetical protein
MTTSETEPLSAVTPAQHARLYLLEAVAPLYPYRRELLSSVDTSATHRTMVEWIEQAESTRPPLTPDPVALATEYLEDLADEGDGGVCLCPPEYVTEMDNGWTCRKCGRGAIGSDS